VIGCQFEDYYDWRMSPSQFMLIWDLKRMRGKLDSRGPLRSSILSMIIRASEYTENIRVDEQGSLAEIWRCYQKASRNRDKRRRKKKATEPLTTTKNFIFKKR